MYYLTTPIFYVNAKPHLGHAYTAILCDTFARYQRLIGSETFFLTGTDEHGEKIVQAADQQQQTPKAYVDKVSSEFRETWSKLDISYDFFIRTTDSHHKGYVKGILQKLYEKGDIYLSEYTGTYCTGCERYITEKELDDQGNCLQHNKPPEKISEKNYFFKMQKYLVNWLKELESNPKKVQPERYYKELVAVIKELIDIGDDLSISRPKSRLEWGIELPFDADYVTYVWFDALYNYISALNAHDGQNWPEYWQESHHFIAKDILKPHGIYWPTMLMAAEQPIYKVLYVHGYWLGWNDQKMSKSLKNAADPLALTEQITEDGFRYFLLREMTFGNDARFSEELIESRLNAELANELGNLAQRSLSMLKKYHGKTDGPAYEQLADFEEIENRLAELSKSFHQHMEQVQPALAINDILELVRLLNQKIEQAKPWHMYKEGDANCVPLLRLIVHSVFVTLFYFRPFLPNIFSAFEAKFELASKTNFPASVRDISCKAMPLDSWPILFKRLELTKKEL